MKEKRTINSIDEFKSIYLPNYFEQESRQIKKHNKDIGNRIAFSILDGIKQDLSKIKK